METLIKKLAEAWGPSGFEHQVRELIREEVQGLADEIRVDALGNLICRVGSGDFRVMTAAHMDEIGLMVSHIDRNGFARFSQIGTLLPATLLGARVRFESGVTGTVAVENIFTQRRNLPELNGFFVDTSDGEHSATVQVGDPAAFVGSVEWRGDRVIGKSLDNRVSCAVQIEAMRRLKETGTPHTVYFVFTVQEEVGSRGTQPAAYGLDPHFGIALDVTATGDTPKNPLTAVELGKGVAIKIKDVGLIVPPAVKALMIQRAEEAQIPYQLEVLDLGSQDGRLIQITRSGVPTGALAVPVRYVHTRSETADRYDIQATVDLLVAILSQPIRFC